MLYAAQLKISCFIFYGLGTRLLSNRVSMTLENGRGRCFVNLRSLAGVPRHGVALVVVRPLLYCFSDIGHQRQK